MSSEVTWICDRCGARHTGALPLMWKNEIRVEFTASGLPTYSPYHVEERAATYCDGCLQAVSSAIKAALENSSTQSN
jgi:hypothetical protein